MKRYILGIALFASLTIVGFGCVNSNTSIVEQSVIDRTSVLADAREQGLIMNDGEVTHMKDASIISVDEKKLSAKSPESYTTVDFKSWKSAALADVTGGSSYGLIHTQFQANKFELAGLIGDLPELTNGGHYNAWLVRRSDGLKVIDLGAVEVKESMINYTYSSGMDLSEYDFFVITEQSEGSTVPGKHILEGMIRS